MKRFSPTCAESLGFFVVSRSLYSVAIPFFLLLVLTLHATRSVAQEATIVGTVADPSGSVVPNVTITVTQTSTGRARSLKTNDAGQYVAPDLNIGTYTVRAEASGFKAVEKKNVVLNVDDRTRIDFVMQVGSVQENVTVEADAVQVQSDSGDASRPTPFQVRLPTRRGFRRVVDFGCRRPKRLTCLPAEKPTLCAIEESS